MKKVMLPIVLSLSSFAAYSMGLGEMTVHSFLSQPFDAEIELLDIGNIPLTGIRADIASPEEFERMGFERENVLNYLSFSVEKNSRGKPVVRIRSSERMTEPYLQMLVEVVWATGQVYRSYNILLDPPAYKLTSFKKSSQSQTVIQVKDTEITTDTDIQVKDTDKNLTYGPTRANETIWQIAQRYRGGDVVLQQMILAIVGANPEAFSEGNLNGLKENVRLKIPSNDKAATISAEDAKLEVFAHDSAWQAKHPIDHVIMPPYIKLEEPNSDNLAASTELRMVSFLPPIPPSNITNPSVSYLPKVNTAFQAGSEQTITSDPQSVQRAKLKTEMDLAISAIQSIRDANALLKEQLALLQTENKRLLTEVKKRDQQMTQLQKEMRMIKMRQGLAGQTSQQNEWEEETSYWPWALLLLLLLGSSAFAYWWFWVRPNKEAEDPQSVEPPNIPVQPSLKPQETEIIEIIDPSVSVENNVVEEMLVVNPIIEEKLAQPEVEKEEKKSEAAASEENYVLEFELVPDEPNLDTVKAEEVQEEKEVEEAPTIESKIVPIIELQETEPKVDEHSLEFVANPVPTEPDRKKQRPVKSQKALNTLLDLAKTYISMGDLEAAKQSLEEVIKNGSKEQQDEAQGLLNQLSKD